MIDEATGYNEFIDEKNKLSAIWILEDMLEAEKYLWLDTKRTEDLIKQLNEI